MPPTKPKSARLAQSATPAAAASGDAAATMASPASPPAAAASAAATSAPKPATRRVQIRRRVRPEIAANVREEDEALAATLAAAKAMASGAIANANGLISAAQEKHAAAMRPIRRELGLGDDAAIVATDGQGNKTVLVIELPALPAKESARD